MMEPSPLPTAGDVAARLNTSKPRVYILARGPLAPCVVRIGRQIRFHPAKLDAWIEAGGFRLPGGWRDGAGDDEPAQG
jgi:hypothetical protein